MKQATISVDESQRLAELYRYEILDTPYEKEFNEIVELASQICKTPISAITLIDNAHYWYKASFGIGGGYGPRENAFCSRTILQNDLMEIPDALKDERFINSPFVTDEPNIRFYAGMPLVTSTGYKLGALCVVDTIPRMLNEEQVFALKVLTKQTVKLIESRLLNKQLSQALETQKQMISILSHDVRNPLATVLSVLEMHENDIVGEEERNDMLNNLKKDIGHTLQMVHNLVDWSKLQLTTKTNFSDTNIYALAEDCIHQNELSYIIKNNKVINSIEKDLTATIDQNCFLFILRNLISNANKFTENGMIKVYNYTEKNRLYICVEDNGIGIEMSNINLILEQPGSHYTNGTNNEKGSGLGLSLIKKYLFETNNTLSITSSPGKGTTVTFSIATSV